MYENAKQKDTIQKLNQAFVEDSIKTLNFVPTIPEASKEIMQKYYQRKAEELKNTKVEHSKQHLIAGSTIEEYFSKSPAERLSRTKPKTDSKSKTAPSSGNKASIKMKADKIDQFVNRLTYEYKDKDAKLKREFERMNNFDPKTGNHFKILE